MDRRHPAAAPHSGDDLRPIVRELRAVTAALADHVGDEPRVVLALLARAGRLVGDGIAATAADPGGTGGPAALDTADPVARRRLTRQWSRSADPARPGGVVSAGGPVAIGEPPRPDGHVHAWPNRYASCVCGERPPVDAADDDRRSRPDPD